MAGAVTPSAGELEGRPSSVEVLAGLLIPDDILVCQEVAQFLFERLCSRC